MDKQGLVTEVSGNNYRVNFTETEAELFRDQLEEHFADEYGRHELIGYLQVHGERLSSVAGSERSPTEDYLDALGEEVPSKKPYYETFGGFSWALHVAGLDTKFEHSREIMEDRLRRAVHEKNSDRDMILETLSPDEIKDSDILPEKLRDKPYFESLEDAYQKSGFQNESHRERHPKMAFFNFNIHSNRGS